MLTKSLPGVMADPLHPLSQGCVGHWLFNEGTGSLAYDVSGHGNHGALKNMLPNVQGSGWCGSKFGGGLDFDGSDDYVQISDSIDVAGAITIVVRVKFSVTGTSTNIAGNKRHQATGYGFLKHSGGHLRFSAGDGTNTDDLDSSGLSWNTDEWYHVAISFESPNGVFYRNGVSVGSDTMTWSGNIGAGIYDLHIGVDPTPSFFLNGNMDEALVYNRALSVQEIKELYHNPFCNLMQVPAWQLYSPAAPTGAIINQFQRYNLGADLYDGVLIT